MLVNKKLSDEILLSAGEKRQTKAKRYINEGRVNIIKSDYKDENNFSVTSIVTGNYDKYEVNIDVQLSELEVLSCECQDYLSNYTACKHIVATLMKLEQTKFWDKDYVGVESGINRKRDNKFKYKNFNNLINSFYNDELEDTDESTEANIGREKVKLEVKVNYDKFSTGLKLEFKIGNKRMYKIKDLPEFYTRMTNNEYFKYGEKLELVHNRDNFEEESKPLLDFILRYSEIMKYSNQSDRYGYYYGQSLNQSTITLGASTIDEAFDLLKTRKVNFDYEYMPTKLTFLEGNPNIEFDLSKINNKELTLRPNIDVFKIAIFNGKKYTYLLNQNVLYRCDEEFTNSSLKMVKAFRENYTQEILLRKEDLLDFYSIIMPKLEDTVKLQGIDLKEIEQYRPEKLAIKVFLDFDENNFLTLDARFCYAEEEFNPLEENVKIKSLRNTLEENKNLNIFKKTGFMLDVKNKRFILPEDEKIYEFLQNDINIYMQKFEVLVTESFKSKEVKEPKVGSIGVKVENNLLNIDLSKLNISPSEIEDVMEKYKLKKKFHRLKDGSFLNLVENEDIEFLDRLSSGMELNYKSLKSNTIKLPVNRTLYLNELLKKLKNTTTTKNNEYNQIINNLQKDNFDENIKIPSTMKHILRDYQKIGYNWLKTLDSYKFGGILADDMGLRKNDSDFNYYFIIYRRK